MSREVYDRTFPPAADMSPKVFDGKLDIGRLKHQLKSRSSTKSKTNGRRSTLEPQSEPSKFQGPPPPMPTLPNMNGTPNVQAFDSKNILPFDDTVGLPNSDSAPPRSKREDTMVSPSSPIARHFSPEMQPSPTRTPSPSTGNFDLRPPRPNKPESTVDGLSERLFSDEHLRVIFQDPTLFLRFTAFLNRYKPQSAPMLMRYLETRKAMQAIQYANALAKSLQSLPGEEDDESEAAMINAKFEARSRKCFDTLVEEVLPAYITNVLTHVVTETMVKEITGTSTPLMRELVQGLAEVFCLTDPSIEDNPIVYSSEEFYRTTQYGRDYVIGRNCRFLQGPKTKRSAIARIKAATKSGQEICETVLNYRRDGSPFLNLLLVAPLYDNRGQVRYFIGAQVDVTGLMENGRGIESFAKVLDESRQRHQQQLNGEIEKETKSALQTLGDLGKMFSSEESAMIQTSSRPGSVRDDGSVTDSVAPTVRGRRDPNSRTARRVLGNDDVEEEERGQWGLSSAGPSGRLPGVYQNYLLVRPSPSLRIIFVSPALRIPGLLQSPFLSRIGGPPHVRDGLADAFASGAAVTAKITWLPHGRDSDTLGRQPNNLRGSGINHNRNESVSGREGRTRYISCTPLWGSDDRVGVWMVVMVENERVTGGLVRGEGGRGRVGDYITSQAEMDGMMVGEKREMGRDGGRENGEVEHNGSLF